jgi:hypothetical protein
MNQIKFNFLFINFFQFSFKGFLETKEGDICNVYRNNAHIVRDCLEEGKDCDVKEEIFKKDFTRIK